jgi:transposase-like protein
MRYPAAEKLEIIRLVEQSPLPVRHTLAKLGIPRATFYRWYDRYSRGGPEALNDRSPRPDRVWNRIPDGVRENVIQLALDEPAHADSGLGPDGFRVPGQVLSTSLTCTRCLPGDLRRRWKSSSHNRRPTCRARLLPGPG